MSIRTYFRTEKGLAWLDVDTQDPGIAQVEAYLIACEEGVPPTSAVLAVIPRVGAQTGGAE